MRSILSALGAACLLFACAARAEPVVVAPSADCKGTQDAPKFALHFVNVELNFLVHALADSFCKSAVIIDMPQGKVTFNGPDQKLSAAKARPILVKLFLERGFAVDEERTQLRIHRAGP
jgi:hypothetical protein